MVDILLSIMRDKAKDPRQPVDIMIGDLVMKTDSLWEALLQNLREPGLQSSPVLRSNGCEYNTHG
jgi:hypothetical protein